MKGECVILLLMYGVAVSSASDNQTLAPKGAANRCRVCGPLAAGSASGSAPQACSVGGRPAPAQPCPALRPYCTIAAQGQASNISRFCHETDYGKFCLLSYEEKSKSYTLACTCKSESCKKIQEDGRMRLFGNLTEQIKTRNATLDQTALKKLFGGGAIILQEDGNALIGRAKIRNISMTTAVSKPLMEHSNYTEAIKKETSQKPRSNTVQNAKSKWPISKPIAAALVDTRSPADDDDDGDIDDSEGSGRLQGTMGPVKSIYEQFTTSPLDSNSLSNSINTDSYVFILLTMVSKFVFVH